MRRIAIWSVVIALFLTAIFVWRGRGDGSGGEPGADAIQGGSLPQRPQGLPRAPLGGSGNDEARGLPSRPSGGASQDGWSFAGRQDPGVARPAGAPVQPETGAAASGDELRIQAPPVGRELETEIAVASALWHLPPAHFHSWIDEHGAELRADRRLLASAFSAALGGARQDWDPVRERLAASDAIEARELALFDRAIGRAGDGPLPPSARGASALEIAMDLELRRYEAELALERRDDQRAARLFSELLLDEIHAPWEADRRLLAELSEKLAVAQVGHRWNRKGDWPSVTMTVQSGDSLVAIRKRFLEQHPGQVVCTGLIDRCNGIEGRYLKPGQELRIPLDEVSMLVDLSARWIFYRFGEEVAAGWPVGIGAPATPTDVGEFTVGEKVPEPVWYSDKHGQVPYGDPRNELGTHWIAWEDDLGPTSLGFHGTNDPETIGRSVSSGCVRMSNQHVAELFEILPRGASVYVQE